MAPYPLKNPRPTLLDLYIEREQIRWYWRALGIVSSTLILAGFVIFPSSFQYTQESTKTENSLSIVSLVLLTSGYSLSVFLWFLCENSLFQLDVLFIPSLVSSSVGLLDILVTIGAHSSSLGNFWSTSSVAALTLALISTLIYSGLTIFLGRKVNAIRTSAGIQHQRSNSESLGLLPEDDRTRQNLLRLLHTREKDKKSTAAPSNLSTYRIDLPESLNDPIRERAFSDASATFPLSAPLPYTPNTGTFLAPISAPPKSPYLDAPFRATTPTSTTLAQSSTSGSSPLLDPSYTPLATPTPSRGRSPAIDIHSPSSSFTSSPHLIFASSDIPLPRSSHEQQHHPEIDREAERLSRARERSGARTYPHTREGSASVSVAVSGQRLAPAHSRTHSPTIAPLAHTTNTTHTSHTPHHPYPSYPSRQFSRSDHAPESAQDPVIVNTRLSGIQGGERHPLEREPFSRGVGIGIGGGKDWIASSGVYRPLDHLDGEEDEDGDLGIGDSVGGWGRGMELEARERRGELDGRGGRW
ncbi:hypothetical protein MMC25_002164 [Agyrium rufum]|nr:hypothetical protein [Agyrium rufum]